MKNKYLWLSDTHLNRVNPFRKYKLIKSILKEKPKAIFLTGDISSGTFIEIDLRLIATFIKCPIYFVLGNHDHYLSSFNEVHNKLRILCSKYDNLIWLTESDVIHLDDNIALVGAEGWYDVSNNIKKHLKINPDFFMIKDFWNHDSLDNCVKHVKELSSKSTENLMKKLKKALELNYKHVYILTHVPPWAEATRDSDTLLEMFWTPYNVNAGLGAAIEQLMKKYPNQNVTVLSGHVHSPNEIMINENIFCEVKLNGILPRKIFM